MRRAAIRVRTCDMPALWQHLCELPPSGRCNFSVSCLGMFCREQLGEGRNRELVGTMVVACFPRPVNRLKAEGATPMLKETLDPSG